MEQQDTILQMEHVTKAFAGVVALNDMQLRIRKGTVHALMGENGAGKSTLMKILTGLYTRDKGDILFDGAPLNTSSIQHVIQQGISMIYQELNPIDNMTVAENIFCGKEPSKAGGLLVDRAAMEAAARQLLEELGHPGIPAGAPVGTLSVAQKQVLEIAKAISNRSRLIIMDEPTSAITETEVSQLFNTVRELKAKGVSFIYITHKMDEVFQIADEVTVMRDGRYVATRAAADVTKDSLVAMMVGRSLTEQYPKVTVPPGETVLEVRGLCVENLLHDVSFTLRRGEILGFAGLMGAGRTETMEAIFGIRKVAGGSILVNGKPAVLRRPADAIAHRMAFLTEDRRATGCYLECDVLDNVMVLSWKRFCSWAGIRSRRCAQACDEQLRRFSVKTRGRSQAVRELSGGNQQKLLLCRWLLTQPDILILDEPTRGIDVGAKYEIYQEMGALARAGKSIIMISSELPEILGMSDRVVVMCEGTVSGILNRGQADQETILRYAAGLQMAREA